MSAIEKAATMLRQEAEAIKACHTLDGDWCGDPTEADYHEMIALADAAIAERDDLLDACRAAWWNSLDLPESVREVLSAAIARATGEQP